MNAQALVCACQLRLRFFAGCATLPQVLQGDGIEWSPYFQSFMVPSALKTPAA